jgi:arabinose-5-phosphate isomerase
MEKDLKNAKTVVSKEKRAIAEIERKFTDSEFRKNFGNAIDIMYKCKGKIVLSGVGKSGIIAQKIASTLNSTGTPSVFLHPADSVHGDIGIIEEGDAVIFISKSGETDEIKNLIPFLKHLKVKIILISGNTASTLGRLSSVMIDSSIKEEACPHNLAPTSSSTATLVLGDALAVALLQKRGFTKEDFASLHPGGLLGKKLLLKVEDIMSKGDEIPVVSPDTKLKDAIYEISSKRFGCAVVIKSGKIQGIITDGDIRRLLQRDVDIRTITARNIMSKNPKTVKSSVLAMTALELMEKNKITQLIISDGKHKLAGILHLHTLVELGL